jgi:hypothetical protein
VKNLLGDLIGRSQLAQNAQILSSPVDPGAVAGRISLGGTGTFSQNSASSFSRETAAGDHRDRDLQLGPVFRKLGARGSTSLSTRIEQLVTRPRLGGIPRRCDIGIWLLGCPLATLA